MGYSESDGAFTLTTGDLTENDVSVLTLPPAFANTTSDLFFVAVSQTHRGTDLNSLLFRRFLF